MIKTFIQTKELFYFSKDAPIMSGTGGLRKLRFSHTNEGKRGGVRVCYVDFTEQDVIYLITVYPKNEKDNLSEAERNAIKYSINVLRESL